MGRRNRRVSQIPCFLDVPLVFLKSYFVFCSHRPSEISFWKSPTDPFQNPEASFDSVYELTGSLGRSDLVVLLLFSPAYHNLLTGCMAFAAVALLASLNARAGIWMAFILLSRSFRGQISSQMG
jgi:hypothetical protein